MVVLLFFLVEHLASVCFLGTGGKFLVLSVTSAANKDNSLSLATVAADAAFSSPQGGRSPILSDKRSHQLLEPKAVL